MVAGINTLRIDNVNTHRIDTVGIAVFMQSPDERLRAARVAAGYSSATKAAEAFGWTESTYRSHENGTRTFDIEMAKRYARAFRIPLGELLAIDAGSQRARLVDDVAEVEVVGKVAAGVWREPEEFEEGERRKVLFEPSPYPHARRFAVEVVGYSMDRVYPPGTILDCLSIYDLEVDPQPGDHVIVERVKPDGRRELTVKRFDVDDKGHPWLMPESTKPEFQAPIRVDDGEESEIIVQVIAFVIGHYSSRASEFARRRKPSS